MPVRVTTIHRFVTGLSPVCHRFVTGLSPVCHRFVTGLSPVYHRFATGLSPVCHRFVTGLSPVSLIGQAHAVSVTFILRHCVGRKSKFS